MLDQTPFLERQCGCGKQIGKHNKSELQRCCSDFGIVIHNLKLEFNYRFKHYTDTQESQS